MIRTLDFGAPRFGSDAEEHTFTAQVDLEEADLAVPAWLHLDGVATVYDVLVNEVPVLSGSSMFARHQVDVADSLRLGTNDVVIRCHPLPLAETPRLPRARWRTRLVDEGRLRWFRTAILGRAPGFAPGPPRVGPWRPAALVTGARVAALRARTSLAGTSGLVEVAVEVDGVSPGVVPTVVLEGPSGERRSVELVEGRARLEVADPALWWPHTHGEPATYRLEIRLGEEVLAARTLGFRTVENADPAGLDLLVNGVPVFVRGAVWTPGDLGALDEAVALGLNLVRLSGIGAYEDDAFFDACARRGLLVWHDLMFATFDYPLTDPEFAETAAEEVRTEIGHLVGNPAVVVVCGSAEHEQQAIMFGLESGPERELAAFLRPVVEATGIDAVWVDSSPSGGRPPLRVDTGIAQYFGVGAYLRDLADARTAGVRFASECLAFSHLPEGAADDLDVGVPRDSGADWDFADVRRHYLQQWYGDLAGEQRDRAAQRVTGEVMAAVFGEWRRADSPCGGGIVLWLRDLQPGAGWGLLDHESRPKPAARVLAPVLQPTAVWILDEGLSGLDVHIAHDPGTPLEATLRVELVRADGQVAEEASRTLTLAPHITLRLGVEELLGRWVDVSWAYRFGEPYVDTVRAGLTAPGLERTASWRRPGADQSSGSM